VLYGVWCMLVCVVCWYLLDVGVWWMLVCVVWRYGVWRVECGVWCMVWRCGVLCKVGRVGGWRWVIGGGRGLAEGSGCWRRVGGGLLVGCEWVLISWRRVIGGGGGFAEGNRWWWWVGGGL
jgi:hypothetical protein